MAKILNDTQTNQIKAIREEIRKLKLDDWLCEGTDSLGSYGLVIFNNELDKYFIVDYFGLIRGGNMNQDEITADLRTLAKLNGKIAQINEFGKVRD